jgi:hypothetical protein
MRRGRLGIGIKVNYLVTNFKEDKKRKREGRGEEKERGDGIF